MNQTPPSSLVIQLFRLSRTGINILVAAAALTGYFLKTGMVDQGAVAVTLGAFLLAAGCSALNQVQEVNRDRLMRRTKDRPVASGQMGRFAASLAALTFLVLSGLLFAALDTPVLFHLMLITIILYNGIYTPLKTRTPFALLVGAVMGSFPPLFGWAAGGGSLINPEIVILALVFYLWQIPHFWLLVDRYRSDYVQAGFPQLFQAMPEPRYRTLMLVWIIAYLVSILLIPLFFPMHVSARVLLTILPAVFLVAGIAGRKRPDFLFGLVNGSIVLVMIILFLHRALS